VTRQVKRSDADDGASCVAARQVVPLACRNLIQVTTEPTVPATDAAQPVTIEVHRLRGRKGTFLTLVSGSMTAPAAQVFEHHLDEVLGSEGNMDRLLLDLSGMTLIDRAGLDVLLDVQRRIVERGGELELVNPSASVVAMLHEADLDPGH
jgi:anti-anti-sigma factor